MKYIFLILVFLIICQKLRAPNEIHYYIAETKSIVFDPLLKAFMMVESNFRTDTINRLGYGGILQIGSQMIEDVNRICKKQGNIKSFTLTDRLDSTKSVEIWYIIQNYYNRSYSFKIACKVWNPTASMKYYQKIGKQLNQ